MLGSDVDESLRSIWLQQVIADKRATLAAEQAKPKKRSGAPLGMDDQRYQLHRDAKQLAQTRCDANPRLDAAEAYSSAVIELADRQNPDGPI